MVVHFSIVYVAGPLARADFGALFVICCVLFGGGGGGLARILSHSGKALARGLNPGTVSGQSCFFLHFDLMLDLLKAFSFFLKLKRCTTSKRSFWQR